MNFNTRIIEKAKMAELAANFHILWDLIGKQETNKSELYGLVGKIHDVVFPAQIPSLQVPSDTETKYRQPIKSIGESEARIEPYLQIEPPSVKEEHRALIDELVINYNISYTSGPLAKEKPIGIAVIEDEEDTSIINIEAVTPEKLVKGIKDPVAAKAIKSLAALMRHNIEYQKQFATEHRATIDSMQKTIDQSGTQPSPSHHGYRPASSTPSHFIQTVPSLEIKKLRVANIDDQQANAYLYQVSSQFHQRLSHTYNSADDFKTIIDYFSNVFISKGQHIKSLVDYFVMSCNRQSFQNFGYNNYAIVLIKDGKTIENLYALLSASFGATPFLLFSMSTIYSSLGVTNAYFVGY